MADHSAPASHSLDHGIDEHRRTYEAFIKGAVALSISCFYVLVALVEVRFTPSFNVLLAVVGLVVGFIAVAIDARAGGRWLLSGGLLVLFGLVTAVTIS